MPNTAISDDRHLGCLIEGKFFYSPSLFHMAPTFDRIVPLAIADVLRAKNVLQVYGVQGLEKHNQGYVIVNNYPIKDVKVAGRLVSYAFKSFDQGGVKSRNNFFLLNIDDCSGEKLCICVKLPESRAWFSLRDLNESSIVEATGNVHYTQDYEKQLNGSAARIVGSSYDLEAEIHWWSRVVQTRRYLQSPWKYTPPGSTRLAPKSPVIHDDDLMEIQDPFNVAELECPAGRRAGHVQMPRLALQSEESQYSSHIHAIDSFCLNRDNSVEIIDLTSESEAIDPNDEPDVSCLPILQSFTLASLLLDDEHENYVDASENFHDSPVSSQESVILIN